MYAVLRSGSQRADHGQVDFILFLNKVDILSAKLRSGVKVQKYVRSYRDRPNTAEAAAKCESRRGMKYFSLISFYRFQRFAIATATLGRY